MDEAFVARIVFFVVAAGAVAFGIWWSLRKDPPGRDPADVLVASGSQR